METLVTVLVVVLIALVVIRVGVGSALKKNRTELLAQQPKKPATRKTIKPVDVAALDDEIFESVGGPGRYKVTGIDRETKMDCVQIYDALGPDNAKVKAELDGIVVTRVERG